MGRAQRTCQPRQAETRVLHVVIREHLDDFLRAAADRGAASAEAGRGRAGSPGYWTWAALMRRAFDLDVLRCPRCAGRMQRMATIEDPAVMQEILAHLGLPGTRDGAQPPLSMTEAGAEQPALSGVTF